MSGFDRPRDRFPLRQGIADPGNHGSPIGRIRQSIRDDLSVDGNNGVTPKWKPPSRLRVLHKDYYRTAIRQVQATDRDSRQLRSPRPKDLR